MSIAPASYQYKCCLCRRGQALNRANIPRIHPVCARILCTQCQLSIKLTQRLEQTCPDAACLYHQDEDRARRLCGQSPFDSRGNVIPALALPLLMSHGSGLNAEQKVNDSTSDTDATQKSYSLANPIPGTETAAYQTSRQPFYEICGSCHKDDDSTPVAAIDLECLIGMCSSCFIHVKGHEDHAHESIIRLVHNDIIIDELLKKFTAVFTTEVVKRKETANYSDWVIKSTHQQHNMNVEEGKVLEVSVKPITQSFLDRLAQIRQCGFALLSIYHDLQQAYNELLLRIKASVKISDSTPTSPTLALPPGGVEHVSSCDNNQMIQWFEKEGKQGIEDVVSRLEGMVSQRMVLIDTFDCVIKLLGLPSTTLGNETEGEEERKEGEDERMEIIQAAFESINMSTPNGATKAVMIVRTLRGIRNIVEGCDISLELDMDGLEILGLKEGVNELILACQSVCHHLQSPKKEDDVVERIETKLAHKYSKVSKMLTIETVHTAMEVACRKLGSDKYLTEGLHYVFGEGGKPYGGAKALAALDIACAKGSKEAMFRKAQLLFDDREGVKRDATLAVTLFEGLKNEGLYLPQVYYYLSKHVLERSVGRTPETYKLVSEYFTKIKEMKVNEEERKDGEVEEKGDKGSEGECHGGGSKGDKSDVKLENEGKNAAILFAQAGVYYIYKLVHPFRSQARYFRKQLSPFIRRWLKDCDFYKLCVQAKEAGCKEPELLCMLSYADSLRRKGEDDHDFKSAMDGLNKACSLGVLAAYHILGRIHSPAVGRFKGCHEDAKEAMSYYLEAERKGYTYGGLLYTDIGNLYWQRTDEEKDGKMALEYFDRGICHGDEVAYFYKAFLYQSNQPPCLPIVKCDKTAHKLKLEAVEAGCYAFSLLFSHLGDDYMLGQGVRGDGSKAVEYYKKAIEYGSPVRLYGWIGRFYDTSGYTNGELRRDNSKALRYYLKEINREKDEDEYDLDPFDLQIYAQLGAIYEDGRGTRTDYNKSVEYYRKAGDKNVYALTRLGVLHDTTQTAKPYPAKDDKEARKYYEAAMELSASYGNITLFLGNMYRDGRGGEMNGTKALECYDKAIGMGRDRAFYEKALIYDPEKKECPPIAKDVGRAVELYLAGYGAGITSQELMLTLADCYRRGRHVFKNEERAKEFEKRAYSDYEGI